ncbi:hypothetical protein LTR02_016342 [Friedmanniomyces endolithicus]|nr:hypothetical protein LTR94_008557 [Friedmanniomyces endolithicus]KAK0771313.1 hypothetical protein LTR59_016151 [Friedmanniomyces endolithicus]KAK0775296.1 hypothetical protein LTR75_016623 [Friedmanniomyces endolithicus]KAK0796491.1 hypothetical protein LTR38_008540 [Friedmanniomyces endolithicus]KAK0828032.1 hypothetical protein LTR03_016661 [Friedmanniomyces endolithicus]
MGSDPHANGEGTNGILLPGTTLPGQQTPELPEQNSVSPPHSFPGPTIDGRQTTTTLYEPAQLALSPIIPTLYRLINKAFKHSHNSIGIPFQGERLQTESEYLKQVGADPGTFVYITSWADSGEPVATAGAHRYSGEEVMAAFEGGGERSTFNRVRMPRGVGGRGEEVWELKLMAVDVGFSGKGLAGHLMRLVDGEVVRRVGEMGDEGGVGRKVWMVITTVTEANGEFYRKRGYVEDYETVHGPGFMGTPKGFRVVHMSKVLRK